MQTTNALWAYIIYLPIVLGLTIYVTGKLFDNAIVYMMDIFHGRQQIAQATNRLFKIGFYLLNMGFALYIMQIHQEVNSVKAVFEILSVKIGGFSIYLGFMLLLNMIFFFKGKKAARQQEVPPIAAAQ